MIISAKQEIDFIKMVAKCLSEKFLEQMFFFNKRRNYSMHVGALAEILDWSLEFYDGYYDTLLSKRMFTESLSLVHINAELDHLITVFGRNRIKKFYTENGNYPIYFFEKYLGIKDESSLEQENV